MRNPEPKKVARKTKKNAEVKSTLTGTQPVADDAFSSFQYTDNTIGELRRIVSTARRELAIYSQELDPALFDAPVIVDSLSQFARQAANCRLRILVHSSRRLIQDRHRLLPLIRRLSSKIQLRQLPENNSVDEQSFVIADSQGYWLLPNFALHQGLAHDADAVQTQHLRERFDQLWERSIADPNLRRLEI